MELPQPPRPLGTEGRKPTHDFLSLYSHSTAHQQDPSQSFQGGYLKTHDFLRPLERIGRICSKEEKTNNVSTAERAAPPLASPAAHNSSVERLLPGGIGTYSISHISYFNQRVPKPEGSVFSVAQPSNTDKSDDTSRCSSLSGSGFTLWDDSTVEKGKTRKENLGENPSLREPAAKIEQWAVSTERPTQSSLCNHLNSFSSLSPSQFSGQQNRSFGEILKSAVNVASKEEELDDGKAFVIKKESSPTTAYTGELRINAGEKCSDQKANTPRSKHSATEQRRRSKINDRFQKLRELIPRSDQKRDKASFLLEVVEYIQFLQEKVRKYESSPQKPQPQGWYHEPAKLIPCRNNSNPAECCIDQSRVAKSGPGPVFIFAGSDEKFTSHSSAFPRCSHNAVESEVSTSATHREADHHPGTTIKATSYPMSQQRHFIPVISEVAKTKFQSQVAYNADNTPCEMQQRLCETRLRSTDIADVGNKLKEVEQSIEGGRISISSAYSQGLLKVLTQALQSSGVDMSQASIAVQVELGKKTDYRETVPTPAIMDDSACPSERRIVGTRVAAAEDLEQAFRKKQKTHKR